MSFSLIKKTHEALVSKKISCLELVTWYINEIKKSNLNAFISVTEDLAIESAKKIDEKLRSGNQISLLEGVPMCLKDNFSTKNIRTTCASKMLENYYPIYNSSVYEVLKENGCILLGKANLDEFAMGSSNETSYFGPVKNPHDNTKVSGGSSGGSCASVAGGLSVFSIGSDTGGSIRQPASFCGIVGFKPSYGSISRYGVIPLASSFDTVGTLSLSVEDASILFDTLSQYDPKDETCSNLPRNSSFDHLNDDISNLKIGVPKNCFYGANDEVYNAVENAIKFYETLGASVKFFDFPDLDLSMPVYCVLGRAETASNMSKFDGIRYGYKYDGPYDDINDLMTKTRSNAFGDEVKRRIILGSYVLSSKDNLYKKSMNLKNLILKEFEEQFKQFDILAMPTSPTTAFAFNYTGDDPIKMYLADICVVPANIAGIPAISIPCGYDSNNLPIGLQLVSKKWSDDFLLRVSYKYEQEHFCAKIIGGVQYE